MLVLVVGLAIFLGVHSVSIVAPEWRSATIARMGERPWRDGREVLQLALRHLPEVFIVTPSGSLLAPNAVEVLMNPDDFASLAEVMEQSEQLTAALAEEVRRVLRDHHREREHAPHLRSEPSHPGIIAAPRAAGT